MKQFTLVIAVLSLLIQSANAQTELSFNKLDSLLKYAENNSITIKTGEQQSLLAKWQKISAQAGLLALGSGLACGAEVILIPEVMEQEEELDRFIQKGIANKKTSGIIMVAEGYKTGGALKIAERVKERHPDIEARVSILGHIQRGGSPTAQDRIVATRMGVAAVDSLLAGKKNLMIGLKNHAIVEVPFNMTEKAYRPINSEFVSKQEVLTRD